MLIIECIFCDQLTSAHNHHLCAKAWGEELGRKVLQCISNHGQVNALQRFGTDLNSLKWQAYQLYLQYAEQEELMRGHMQKVEKDVFSAATRILNTPEALANIQSANSLYRGRRCEIQVTVSVKVTEVLRC
jgi:hypothetical protein